ncbi:MAG: VanZ family protein [Prevotella sp.]|nr:VanZ family protein [Prevotella sp.]
MNTFRHLLRCYPLTLICVALIWYLCLFVTMPETPMDDVPFIDKWTHLVMYGGTTSVMWWEYLRHHRQLTAWKLVLFAFVGPIVMSGCIELLQAYCTTTRAGEWLDFAANSLGVILGNGIGMLMWNIKRRKQAKAS